MNSVLDHAESVAAHVDDGKGTLGRLIRDEALVQKFEDVIQDVGDFTGRIKRMQVQWGVRSEFSVNAQEPRNYFTFKLQPSPEKYYRLQLVDDFRLSVESKRIELTEDGERRETQEITTTTDSLKFSLEFARRYGFFTGRVGLIESTGGFGADFQFFDDKVAVSTDVFDFASSENPRIKSWLGLSLIPHLTIVGGVDDYINKDTRDFFAGLYLHFTDNDLKALFATTPSVSF
jgi:phospholipid/cholesterol/gamma-HCH transport system substrate-binding protein